MLELFVVRIDFPADANIIVGQSHFIKTAEELYEAIVTAVPQAKFGVAFNEASGACLTRSEGNDPALWDITIGNARALGAGHTFVLILQNAYPINVLGAMQQRKRSVFAFLRHSKSGRANCRPERAGRGVLGVIDGSSRRVLRTRLTLPGGMNFFARLATSGDR